MLAKLVFWGIILLPTYVFGGFDGLVMVLSILGLTLVIVSVFFSSDNNNTKNKGV